MIFKATKTILQSPAYLVVTFHTFCTFLMPLISFSFNLKHAVINYQLFEKETIWRSCLLWKI